MPMKILETRVYRGPSYWEYAPHIRMVIDLQEYERKPTNKLPGFTDALLEQIPGLQDHTCSRGVSGGFVERLREGTWLGHVTEHVAIALQTLAGTDVKRGKTRGADKRGVYNVVFTYVEEEVGKAAGRFAFEIVSALARGETYAVQPVIDELARMVDEVALGPSTLSLVEEAHRRGIPYIRLNRYSLIQLGYGINQRRLEATVTSETLHIATNIASNKDLTKQLLHDVGIPVPRGKVARRLSTAASIAQELGYPLVVKPLDANHGRGITVNLTSDDQLAKAFEFAQEHGSSDRVIVEQYITGRDHRILVVNGKVVAVAERVPAHVVGDGQRTISQLIDEVNSDPRRGVAHEKVLTKIKVDGLVLELLRRKQYDLDTVPAAGESVTLRTTANMSTGGTAIDRTDEIHYDNIEVCVRAARVVGLDVAGIDMVIPDISHSIYENGGEGRGGAIVEVNAAPGFRMHVQPSEGSPRNVAKPVIDMLFPPGSSSRIPLIAITGTNGKTTTTRMVAHILKLAGRKVGMTTTDGIYIDGKQILHGDMTGPRSARVVLRDPTVSAAVLETARGGILREGLGFDRCDVGAVLNVSGDHLGLGGIDTLEQMAEVKSLVIEVVRRDGSGVLNADDPLVAAMATKCSGKVSYFSMDSRNPLVRKHVAEGGMAVVLEQGVHGDMITVYNGEQRTALLWTSRIPATLDGMASFNVANALAATTICTALDISVEDIRQGLQTFDTSYFLTPGRLNVFDKDDFKVILDYGHNAVALNNIADLVGKMKKPGGHTLAVFSAAGDRRDEDIREFGAILGRSFEQLILKEDKNKRGRKSGEATALVREGAEGAGLAPERIREIADELAAVRIALDGAERNDLIVLFADDVERVADLTSNWMHQPVLPNETVVDQEEFATLTSEEPLAADPTHTSGRGDA